jgi:hypothetical protein
MPARLTLLPVPLGPGFARLGVVRFRVLAGPVTGTAEITAQMAGGPAHTLRVVVAP